MKWPEDFIGKVVQGDCVDVMREMPDKCVDLVLTDPPYGIDYQSNWSKYGPRHKKIHGDMKYPVHLIEEFKRLAKNAVLVFCRWDNLKDLPKPKSFIVWDKGNHSMGDLKHEYGRRWEGICFYAMEGHEFIKRPADLIFCPRIGAESLTHPNEKPVPLIEILIGNLSGDSILDPFAGSGSTLVAAERCNRQWAGIEIDKEKVSLCRSRIDLETAQGKLF